MVLLSTIAQPLGIPFDWDDYRLYPSIEIMVLELLHEKVNCLCTHKQVGYLVMLTITA